MGIQRKRPQTVSVATLCFGLLTAFVLLTASGLSVANAQQMAKVKMGYIGIISDAPIFIAIDKGYYKEEAIDVELIRFQSGAKMVAPMATGELDVSTGSVTAGLINSVAQGMDFKVVADKVQIRPGYSYVSLLVRTDLLDTGKVKSVKDLNGTKVALTGKGTASDFILAKILESDGLKFESVQLVYLPPPNQLVAFENKAIDAAVVLEPWAAMAEDKGVAKRFFLPEKVEALQDLQTGVIMYSGKFMRERPDVAKKFIRAYLKAIKFYNTQGPKNDEVLNIISKHTEVPKKTLAAAIPFYLADDGKPSIKSIKALQDWFLEKRMIDKPVTMDQLLNLSFLQ